MYWQQVGVILLCIIITLHRTLAVVNNGKTTISNEANDSTDRTSVNKNNSNSVVANIEKTANRREISANTISDSYNVPIGNSAYSLPLDSYLPPIRNNLEPPAPVYGVPNQHINFPVPAVNYPPPLPPVALFPTHYGTPNPTHTPHLKLHQALPLAGPKPNFHQQAFGFSGVPHGSKTGLLYGPPPLTVFVKPQFGIPPKPNYGLPPKVYKPSYNLPVKLKFVPPKPVFASLKPLHSPPKVNDAYGLPFATYGPPHTLPLFQLPKYTYTPIKDIPKQSSNLIHLPLEPINHGPVHPKALAPPTPPDIKYDGWQPIPGLVSRPYLNTYGVPHQANQFANGLDLKIILSPPQNGNQNIGNNLHEPSDSYGAPLNSITGSGGTVSGAINHHLSHDTKSVDGSFSNSLGGLNNYDNSLSVVKSVEYNLNDVNLNGKITSSHSVSTGVDSYAVPPPDSYSPTGPYPAAVSQLPVPTEGVNLIHYSGAHDISNSGHNNVKTNLLLHTNVPNNPLPLNSLDINPPKSPVVFREPVPPGLIESIGESVAYKDALGIPHSQTNLNIPTYIPPPIPDVTKQKHRSGIPLAPPSNLYSLPNAKNPAAFHSVISGSPNIDLTNNFAETFSLDSNHGNGIALSSYAAPLSAIDSSHGLPLQSQAFTSHFDHSQAVDLSSINFGVAIPTYNVPGISLQSTLPLPHDCPQFGSHQTTNDLNVGLPSNYATSFSSIDSNIDDQSYHQVPLLNYEATKLQTVYPLQNSNLIQTNLAGKALDNQGQAINQDYLYATSSHENTPELHTTNNIQSIPIQGTLGSYTLQVQPADDILGKYRSTDNIPHDKILSKDLLQSILSAIEQPQEIQQNQQYEDLQHASSNSISSREEHFSVVNKTQTNISTQNYAESPDDEAVDKKKIRDTLTRKNSLPDTKQVFNLIDTNEIALYFNVPDKEKSNSREQQESQTDTVNQKENNFPENKIRNGQQYGTFSSLKASNIVNKNLTSTEERTF